jgi:hypothetical protein
VAVKVAGRGGVAVDASAVSLNVTATAAAAAGYLTVYPCDGPRPSASNLNYVTGGTVPNAVVSKIAADGTVCFYAQSPVHLVIDVNGYFPATSTFHPLVPARLLDTRPGGTTIDGASLGAGAAGPASTTTVRVTGRGGVAADAGAVVLNVTVTEPAGAGYVTVFPCGSAPPNASNINYVKGTAPNLVIAKVGQDGSVCLFTQQSAHLVVDTLGYMPPGDAYSAIAPQRVLDTRPGQPTIDGQTAGAGSRAANSISVVPLSLRAGLPVEISTAVLNVTVTEPAAPGYLTVYPCGAEPPLASNLNFVAGQTVANAVMTKVGFDGSVCVFNSAGTHVVVDVAGYYP